MRLRSRPASKLLRRLLAIRSTYWILIGLGCLLLMPIPGVSQLTSQDVAACSIDLHLLIDRSGSIPREAEQIDRFRRALEALGVNRSRSHTKLTVQTFGIDLEAHLESSFEPLTLSDLRWTKPPLQDDFTDFVKVLNYLRRESERPLEGRSRVFIIFSDFLHDHVGVNLGAEASWERAFKEAATAANVKSKLILVSLGRHRTVRDESLRVLGDLAALWGDHAKTLSLERRSDITRLTEALHTHFEPISLSLRKVPDRQAWRVTLENQSCRKIEVHGLRFSHRLFAKTGDSPREGYDHRKAVQIPERSSKILTIEPSWVPELGSESDGLRPQEHAWVFAYQLVEPWLDRAIRKSKKVSFGLHDEFSIESAELVVEGDDLWLSMAALSLLGGQEGKLRVRLSHSDRSEMGKKVVEPRKIETGAAGVAVGVTEFETSRQASQELIKYFSLDSLDVVGNQLLLNQAKLELPFDQLNYELPCQNHCASLYLQAEVIRSNDASWRSAGRSGIELGVVPFLSPGIDEDITASFWAELTLASILVLALACLLGSALRSLNDVADQLTIATVLVGLSFSLLHFGTSFGEFIDKKMMYYDDYHWWILIAMMAFWCFAVTRALAPESLQPPAVDRAELKVRRRQLRWRLGAIGVVLLLGLGTLTELYPSKPKQIVFRSPLPLTMDLTR